jgi:hypothetical protein
VQGDHERIFALWTDASFGLNVAISRARCLAVLICNPELLHIRCRNAEQMRLLNALCWFVEMAGEAG